MYVCVPYSPSPELLHQHGGEASLFYSMHMEIVKELGLLSLSDMEGSVVVVVVAVASLFSSSSSSAAWFLSLSSHMCRIIIQTEDSCSSMSFWASMPTLTDSYRPPVLFENLQSPNSPETDANKMGE